MPLVPTGVCRNSPFCKVVEFMGGVAVFLRSSCSYGLPSSNKKDVKMYVDFGNTCQTSDPEANASPE